MKSLKLAAFCVAVVVSIIGVSASAHAEEAVEHVNTGRVLPKGLPFSEAVRVGQTLYLSGMIGIKPGTMDLAQGGIAAEARQTMDNIKSLLASQGYTMNDVVKCTIMLADISEWPVFNDVYRTYFEESFPARSAFGTNGLALGARVEVECVAVKSP